MRRNNSQSNNISTKNWLKNVANGLSDLLQEVLKVKESQQGQLALMTFDNAYSGKEILKPGAGVRRPNTERTDVNNEGLEYEIRNLRIRFENLYKIADKPQSKILIKPGNHFDIMEHPETYAKELNRVISLCESIINRKRIDYTMSGEEPYEVDTERKLNDYKPKEFVIGKAEKNGKTIYCIKLNGKPYNNIRFTSRSEVEKYLDGLQKHEKKLQTKRKLSQFHDESYQYSMDLDEKSTHILT